MLKARFISQEWAPRHIVGSNLSFLMALYSRTSSGFGTNGRIQRRPAMRYLRPATIAELCLVMTADHFGLIAKGMKPGVEFGVILDKAFEAQLEGSFTELEGALKWLEAQI